MTTIPAHSIRIDTPTADTARFALHVATATCLVDILDVCDQFLRNLSRPARVALAEFSIPRSGVTSSLLITMVGVHATHLHARLDQHRQPGGRAGTGDDQLSLPVDTVEGLLSVLVLCDEFIRTGPDLVRAELGMLCTARAAELGNVMDLGCLIDQLGLQTLHLGGRLGTRQVRL